jgi:hypothetical protein
MRLGAALPLRCFSTSRLCGLSAEIERLVLAKLEAMTEEEVASLQPR